MSDLLAIGRSGIIAYRTALSAVGENVTNAETEGYTRRTATLKESAVSSSSNYQYRSSAVFGGVNVASIDRVFDNYRSSYARFASSEAARADAKATWLDVAEGALDDSDVGLGTKMSAVFTQAEALSADVQSDTNRRTMLSALGDVANQFRVTSDALASAAEGVATTARNAVDQLNANLLTLAQINAGLRRAAPGSAGQSLLLDQRDAVLQGIAKTIGIDVRLQDDGQASVNLLGNSAAQLVEAGTNFTSRVGLVESNDGRLSLVSSGINAQAIIVPQSGLLAGLVDVSGTIASRREALDATAATFVSTINTWNQAGIDRNGDPGAALMAGTNAADIEVVTTDVAKVAAASTSGIANANALALRNYRNASGPEAKWEQLVSTHANSVSAAKTEQAATANQRDGALVALDEVTGVDLDVEAAQLLRFQQAYSGSARIIQVARETLQEIMSLF